MRLRDACVLGGAFLVLLASGGCKNLHSGRSSIEVKHDNPHIKSAPVTPRQRAENQIALAQEYWQQGEYEIALEDIQKAIKIDGSYPEAYMMLGLLNEKINRPDQASAAYERSVKLAPSNGAILNNYGAWLCRSGHPAEADEQFRRALADPFYKTPLAALGNAAMCASQAGRADLAEGYDRRMLAADPNNVDALYSLGAIAYQRGDYIHARAFAERLLAGPKVLPESLDLAARIEDKLGDAKAARDYRERLAAEFPNYVPQKF